VLDEAARPICSETRPGNATDVTSLLPILTRLRDRFGIRHICVVADRGMISQETIAELEARGINCILGARERSSSEIREVVLTDRGPMVPLTIPRAGLRTRHRGQGGDRRRLRAGSEAASLGDLFQSRRGTP
jgi:hypothetical protein